MYAYRWQKSSYSNAGANCLHVATSPDGSLRIRESDDPEVILSIARGGLAAFLAAVKDDGEQVVKE
ncbi:DUF397 domain-containing protein [Streptomyces sp. NRRL F-5755]|uniref:DUF397 domain-containing protein n=1 Tax=Streptomyces sp. NRRL F-5755 TaxID=1519475 RepID=UPI00099C594A|nr:DUF397 domain-containing protein [Streptomyces sp. NRRL F-5755]